VLDVFHVVPGCQSSLLQAEPWYLFAFHIFQVEATSSLPERNLHLDHEALI
jgi:hypothetical protein